MAEIILDLSGQKGLADNFHGDTDMITPRPELRISKTEGDLVSGLFNPYLRNGYLAPITTASSSLTIDTTPELQLASIEYDSDDEYVYYADRVNSIYQTTSLTDTSIVLLDSIETSEFDDYDELHDLQIYQINGVKKLFFSGRGSMVPSGFSTADYPEITIGTLPSANDCVSSYILIRDESGTKPTVLASVRDFQSGSSATMTTSVTTVTGSNTCLTVITAYSGSSVTVSGITFNGTAMSSVSAESTASSGIAVYRLETPFVGTANVVVTYSGAVTNRLLYAINTNNTDQTASVRAITDSTTSSTIVTNSKRLSSKNQLSLIAAYSDEVMTYGLKIDTTLFNTTNAYGSDALFIVPNGLLLEVGYADLPMTTVTRAQATWFMGTVADAFSQEVYSDYVFMRTADNGFMYLFADNHVHKIDGTTTGGVTGLVTKDVILFPDYFRITDALDYRSRMYIAVHQYPVSVADTSLNTYTGKCGLYVWNRISTQLSGADYIEIPGVREIKKIYISPDGNLKLITISDNGITQLREFGYNDSGGVVFPVFKTLGIGAYPQFPDGLTTAGDKVTWLANDGNIYCEKNKAVTKLFQVKAPGTTTATLESNIASGVLFYGNGDETADSGYRSNKQALTFSYLDGATHHVKKIYPFDLKNGSNSTQAQHQGDVYTGVTLLPMHSVLRQVSIYNAPYDISARMLTENSEATTTEIEEYIILNSNNPLATVKLYFNQHSTPDMVKTITLSEAQRGYVDFKINKQYIHAVQIEIEWATDVNLSDDMYLPSAAVISYDQTNTKSLDNG